MSALASLGGKPVRDSFLPFSLPTIEEDEVIEVVNTLKSGWITTGPKTHEFEKAFGEYVGSKHAIALGSCTSGLHLSLVAAGIADGDEVITSPFTFAATANVIVHQRAKPIFVDIDPRTFNIDPEKIEAAVTDKTRAILPVHYGGQPCEMDDIMSIARKYDLMVIEDAAHALGATYKGKKIGTLGHVTCFSFHATKNITTAEGGMVTTAIEELAEKIRLLSLHGMTTDAWTRYSLGSSYYEIVQPGYKYNMTDIQASLGLHQLRKLDRFQEARRKLANLFNEAFAAMPEIVEPQQCAWVTHAWHLYPIRINSDFVDVNRDKFVEALKEENIGTSVHFIPLHTHPYYRHAFGFQLGDFPNAERIYERVISLPLYPKMNQNDAEDVVNAVKKVVSYYRR